MIGTKMKYDLKDLKMNRKTLLLACLATLIGMPGCVLYRSTSTTQDSILYGTQDDTPCVGASCEEDPFINYTETRASYREYGEMSPQDSIVSQAAAGNNLSAAIPPSIEDEVISYQAQVEQQVPVVEDQPCAECPATATEETVSTETEQKSVEATNTEEAKQDTATEEKSEKETQENSVAVDDDAVQDWYAEEGDNLKSLLTKWSEDSGWRLVWKTNRNYVLNAGAMFRGRFADVSSALIRAFARARPAPVATFYKGNRVLVVETMEDENAFD